MSHTRQSVKMIKVFYSYSHKDEAFRDEIEKCLVMLRRQSIIESWHDRKIGAGNEWAGEINEHLNTADIILLLVSPDFLASAYCYDVEVKRAMERHEAEQARVIPIILRTCDWKHAPFSKLQALPKDLVPVKKFKDPDDAYLDIATGISKAIEEIIARSPGEKHTSASSLFHIMPSISDKHRYLLPYLCDRSEQVMHLEKALEEHRPNRPFICFVHGDEQECHDMFLERLRLRSLHRILKLKREQTLKEHYSMAWPSNYKPSRDPLDSFRSSLSRMLQCGNQASNKDMARRLAIEKDPVVIHADLLTRDWKPDGQELIESFIRCWSEWPDLPPDRTLIICILLRYENGKQRGFLSRRKWASHNRQIRTFLSQLKFQERYNLGGAVLPELSPIRQTDVVHWIHTDARSIQGDRLKIDDCIRATRSIYANRDAIEMDVLAEHLKQMLGYH